MLLLEGKFGIRILIHNHMGIPLLAKFVPRNGSFAMDYKEILDITESYSVGKAISRE